jgi:hypothetical protein
MIIIIRIIIILILMRIILLVVDIIRELLGLPVPGQDGLPGTAQNTDLALPGISLLSSIGALPAGRRQNSDAANPLPGSGGASSPGDTGGGRSSKLSEVVGHI